MTLKYAVNELKRGKYSLEFKQYWEYSGTEQTVMKYTRRHEGGMEQFHQQSA